MEPTAEEEMLLDSARRKMVDGQLQEALADLRAALNVDSRRVETRMLLVQCLCDMGQFDDGLQEATNLVLVSPQRPEGYAWQATIELERDRPQEALSSSLQILEIDPADAVGLTLYARSAARLGAPVESWDAIEAALAREPDSADAQYAAGDVAYALGDYETAEWHLTKALMLDPAQEDARQALAIVVTERHNGAVSTSHVPSSQVVAEQASFASTAGSVPDLASTGGATPADTQPAAAPRREGSPQEQAHADFFGEQASEGGPESPTPSGAASSGATATPGEPKEIDARIVVGLLVLAVVIGLAIGQVTGSIAGPVIGLVLVAGVLGWVFWSQRRGT